MIKDALEIPSVAKTTLYLLFDPASYMFVLSDELCNCPRKNIGLKVQLKCLNLCEKNTNIFCWVTYMLHWLYLTRVIAEDFCYNLTFIGMSCRLFEWNSHTSTDEKTLSLRSSEKALEQLEDVVQQLAMTFNSEGSLIAVGGEVKRILIIIISCFEWNFNLLQVCSYVKLLVITILLDVPVAWFCLPFNQCHSIVWWKLYNKCHAVSFKYKSKRAWLKDLEVILTKWLKFSKKTK